MLSYETQQITDKLQQVRNQLRQIVIGQEQVIDQVIVAFLSAGHVLVEGVPGLGKTLLIKALAKTFNGDFSRIQFTPDLMPSDVMGHAFFDMKTQEFTMRKGPVFCNLLLADEINRAPAKTQSALLEVMQERQVTIEGEGHSLEAPFMVLATQNPLEQEGTYPLPEAQLDRFLMKVFIDYPNESDETRIVKELTSGRSSETLNVEAVEALLNSEEIILLQQKVSEIMIDDRVLEYAVKCVRRTRDWPGIVSGAGPRAALALVRVAKAYAFINRRTFVTPDDIKEMAQPTLRHRLILSPEMNIEGRTEDDVLKQLLESTDAPRS